MVENLPCHAKVKGSSPVGSASIGCEKMAKKLPGGSLQARLATGKIDRGQGRPFVEVDLM